MGGTMRLGADPVKLHDGTRIRRALRRAGRVRAPPAPLRGQQPSAPALEAAGLVCSGTSPDERLVEVIELAADDHPFFVASQYHPEFKSRPERPAPLFREFVGAALGRADAVEPALAAGETDAGDASPAPPRGEARHRRRARAARTRRSRRCAGSRARRAASGACADWVTARARADRARGRGGRRRAAPVGLGTAGQSCSARDPAAAEAGQPTSILLCAHLDTVPLAAPVEPVRRRRRLGERQRGDPRRRQQGRGRGDARARPAAGVGARSRPRSASSCCSPSARRSSLRGAQEFDASAAAQPRSATCSTTPRRSARSCSPRRPTTGSSAELRGRAAHAGIEPEDGPQRDRRRVGRDRVDAARPPGPRDDRQRRPIEGGTAINVVPERCWLEAEARSLDAARAEAVATEIVDHLQDAANAYECDLDVTVERMFEGYRTRAAGAAGAAGRAGAAGVRIRARSTSSPAAPRTPTRSRAPASPCTSLANGTERNHQSDERVSVEALEGMFEVAIALIDEAGPVPDGERA